MIIYADVLICINLILDYFLLGFTALLLKTKISFFRQLIGAFVGGLSSLMILIERESLAVSITVRVITSVLVVLSTFGFSSVSLFVRRICVFFSASFLFSGCMTALIELINPIGLIVHNGIVYYDLSALLLVTLSGVIYVVLSLILRFSKRSAHSTCRLKIEEGNGGAEIIALIDSGNRLKEPFSEKWVLLLDPRYSSELKGEGKPHRIIPYSTISGEGMISGFIPDSVSILPSGEALDVYIAFSPKPLEGEWGAVISSDAI